jgi:hypothetical protein
MRTAVVAATFAVAAVAVGLAVHYRPRPAAESAGQQWGLFKSYCVECHDSAEFTAGIAFDTLSPRDVPDKAELFERVVRKLRGRAMPPPGNPRPDNARVESFVGWLEAYLDESAAATPRPGRVGLHRLNRRTPRGGSGRGRR